MTVVSLSLAGLDPDAFGQALRTHGFAIVSDHGIDAALIAEAETQARRLFALPEADKRRFHVPGTGGARGYTPFGTEAAKDAATVDLKEFWHIGRDLPAGHSDSPFMPANLWPDLPGFRETMRSLFAAFDTVGTTLLAAVAHHLGIHPDNFAEAVRNGNSVLRLLHYPPVPANAPGIRAAAHEDINVLTLLLGAEEAGLELCDRAGRWLPVTPLPGQLVVNVGDMLQRETQGALRSATHRVRNPPDARRHLPRYSMPFFLHFRPGHVISGPEPITAQDYLEQRLREIRLL